MSFINDLQDTAETYGGNYSDLPAKVKRELCGEWIRELPPLEIFNNLPDTTARYLFSEILGEMVEHSGLATGKPYKDAVNTLIEGLVPFALASAEKSVERQYNEETPADNLRKRA